MTDRVHGIWCRECGHTVCTCPRLARGSERIVPRTDFADRVQPVFDYSDAVDDEPTAQVVIDGDLAVNALADRCEQLQHALAEAVAYIKHVGGYMAPEHLEALRRWERTLRSDGR